MATSGTTDFNLDLSDLIEEAYELCQIEVRTSYHLTTARRSLDLLLQEWANDQVNIWKVTRNSLGIVAAQAQYTLPNGVLDVLDGVLRTDATTEIDIPLERISFETYLDYPDKLSTGRPSQYAVLRGRDNAVIYFFVNPDVSTYTFEYWALNYIQDAGASFTNNIDVPKRFMPALVTGLAYKLSLKNAATVQRDASSGQYAEGPGVSAAMRGELKNEYTQLYAKAREEDRDRASFRVRPRIARI